MEEHEHHGHEEHHEHHASENAHHGEHAHHEEHARHKPTMKLWIMAAAIALLIILSGIQAVELVSLKSKLDKGALSLGSGKSAVSTGSDDLNDNLKNLPSMVGGC